VSDASAGASAMFTDDPAQEAHVPVPVATSFKLSDFPVDDSESGVVATLAGSYARQSGLLVGSRMMYPHWFSIAATDGGASGFITAADDKTNWSTTIAMTAMTPTIRIATTILARVNRKLACSL